MRVPAPEYAKENTANAHIGPIHSYQHDYALHPSWAVIVGPEYTGDLYPARVSRHDLLGGLRWRGS